MYLFARRSMLDVRVSRLCLRRARPRGQLHRATQRRHLSTPSKPEPKPEDGRPATPNSAADRTTIPSPGSARLRNSLRPLTYPLRAYGRAQNRRPYVTQLASSLVIYFLGDLSSQMIQAPTAAPTTTTATTTATTTPTTTDVTHEDPSPQTIWTHYDPRRSLRAMLIGGLSSIPSYHWFIWLSHLFPSRSHPTRLTLQVLINQVVFAPLFNTYFFGMQSLLSGNDIASAARRVSDTLPTSWINSCKFWPLVTALNFSFVRPQSRSATAGVVAVAWQAYLGLLNRRAEEVERGRSSLSSSSSSSS